MDKKELEIKKRQEREEFEKIRDEENLKIKKEKKVLEQRIKNLQFSSGNGASETLKKQLNQAKFQIENLQSENHDLKIDNQDLRSEMEGLYFELKELR